MEAFQLEQELAKAARHDFEQEQIVQQEKEKLHRDQQKVKVVLSYTHLCYISFC